MNHVVTFLLARNSFDLIQTSHGTSYFAWYIETLDANFEVLQETLIFYNDVFVIRDPQLTIPVLNYLNRVLLLPPIYGFYIFSWKYVKKASQIQNFWIFGSFDDIIFNFEIYNLRIETFKKIYMETELFLKVFSPNFNNFEECYRLSPILRRSNSAIFGIKFLF
jgi:hypothetical protein